MSRAQAMEQRAREAAGEVPEDPAKKPQWFKLLLMAGGIGVAAAWLTSPTRRTREDHDFDDRQDPDRADDREDDPAHDSRRVGPRDGDRDSRRDDLRRSETCECGRALPGARSPDDRHLHERDHGERGDHWDRG